MIQKMLMSSGNGGGSSTDYSYSIVKAFSKSGTNVSETITVDPTKRYFIISTPHYNYVTSPYSRIDMYFYRDGVLTKKQGGGGDSDMTKTNDTTLTYTINSSLQHVITVLEEVAVQ